jgi:isopenicillin N synthase-like dioxygenase
MGSASIPVVDLREAGTPEFTAAVGDALRDIGFFAVAHHAIAPELLARAYTKAAALFALSDDAKRACERPDIMRQRGYTSFGQEHARDSNAPDLKEFWMVGRELPAGDPHLPHWGPNVWPAECPGFREATLALYDTLGAMADMLLEACALYLGEEGARLREMAEWGDTTLRVIHYPPLPPEIPAGSIRSGAHEDINLITLLCASTASGLQLQKRDGGWLNVRVEPEMVIVDSGDMLQNLTNGVFPAVTHRVVNPRDASQSRFSLPYFVHPRSDADLTPLASCVALCDGEVRYPSLTAAESLEMRLREIGLGK